MLYRKYVLYDTSLQVHGRLYTYMTPYSGDRIVEIHDNLSVAYSRNSDDYTGIHTSPVWVVHRAQTWHCIYSPIQIYKACLNVQ